MPVSTTTGNSSPLAAWMVITRTDSSSDSGTGDSVTRAPSAIWFSTHWIKALREPPPAAANCQARSTTNR